MNAARESAQRLKGNPEKFVAMVFLSLRFVDGELDSLELKLQQPAPADADPITKRRRAIGEVGIQVREGYAAVGDP